MFKNQVEIKFILKSAFLTAQSCVLFIIKGAGEKAVAHQNVSDGLSLLKYTCSCH